MESTVINQAQENANQQPQQATAGSNNTATGHHHADPHHEDPGHPQMQQQRFRSGGGQNPFFFDMDDPRDFFTNPALRTRLSRFQNPFNSMFGQRKRRTSPPPGTGGVGGGGGTPAGADPYHDDFFASHFDSPHWNNEPRGWPPMNGGRKRMQDHPSDRNNNQDMFNYIPEEFRQYMPEHVFQHRQAPTHQQQPQQQPTNQAPPHAHPQQHQQPTYSQRSNSGDLRRPQFCDMGIQTDDLPQSGSGGNLSDHPQEPSHPQPHDPHHHHQQQPQQQSPNHPGSFARSSADVGVGNSPNGSFASANAYSSSGGGGAGRDVGDGQRQTRSNSNSMGNVRRVPIIVEGGPSSFPKESHMPHRAPPTRQEAPPQPSPPARPPHPGPPPAREVPIQRPTEPPSPSVESINKIQDIQQDVLDLMFKVEQYKGGNKNDKEYKYLDEMLTRNLLKLDTIDTRGNDSIRLARKEAIKCIQASLSVLEAKVGEGKEAPAESSATDEADSAEKIEAEVAKEATESPVIDKTKIAIPLPPIPGQVPPPTIRDCNSDEEDGEVAPIYVSEKKVELKTNK